MSLRNAFDLTDFEGSHSPNSVIIYLYAQEMKQRWQGGLHRKARSSRQNSNVKRKCIGGGSRGR